MYSPRTFLNISFTTKFDYVGTTNPVYIGESSPGKATSDPAWRIKKLTYDTNGNVTDIKFANGQNEAFTVKWDDRATLNYS